MKNINKIVYYLLIASANIFLTTAQQFTIDLNKKSCAKEGIIEVELSINLIYLTMIRLFIMHKILIMIIGR